MSCNICVRWIPSCDQKEQISLLGALGIMLIIFMVRNFQDTAEIAMVPKPVYDLSYASVIPQSPKQKPPDEEVTLGPHPDIAGNVGDNYVKFTKELSIRLWIDVPNAFPWRKCLHEYTSRMFTYQCSFSGWEAGRQQLKLVPLQGSQTKFQLHLGMEEEKCVQEQMGLVVLQNCTEGTYWRWTKDALLEWSGGGCLASTGAQNPTTVVPCDKLYDDQIVEIGVMKYPGSNHTQLAPLDLTVWKERMEKTRQAEMSLAKVEVDKVIKEIKEANSTGQFESLVEGTRRAVVFYVDKGSGFLAYLTWWLYTWRKIGLDTEKEAFDIILMTHPKSVTKLPKDCVPVPSSFDPTASGPGQCLWKEVTPISERDHRYDNYLNSQECLFNPAADFLLKYRLLIRADLDTFPTPAMVGYWPTDVICNRNAGTTHYRDNIENAIIATAKAAGITHRHWHNTDSAWMGPAKRVVALSKLTTYLARFTRVHMFGPGTMCRCATCSELPKECEWGQGIYAGTLLLYAQEIAMNHLWTQREYDEQTYAILDGSCTDMNIDVCTPALLHARHNSEPFSKFTFLSDKYKKYNMAKLDITNVRDYAMFMALSSANQGVGRSTAWERFTNKTKTSLSKLCQDKGWKTS